MTSSKFRESSGLSERRRSTTAVSIHFPFAHLTLERDDQPFFSVGEKEAIEVYRRSDSSLRPSPCSGAVSGGRNDPRGTDRLAPSPRPASREVRRANHSHLGGSAVGSMVNINTKSCDISNLSGCTRPRRPSDHSNASPSSALALHRRDECGTWDCDGRRREPGHYYDGRPSAA